MPSRLCKTTPAALVVSLLRTALTWAWDVPIRTGELKCKPNGPGFTRLGESLYRLLPGGWKRPGVHLQTTTRAHTHTGTSHRVTVAMSDLNPTLNAGATYWAEAQYATPHEYAWCQAHAGQCNQYNNVSYRRFNVTTASPTPNPTFFAFAANGSTVRMQPAIKAWTGATINQIEPGGRSRWHWIRWLQGDQSLRWSLALRVRGL